MSGDLFTGPTPHEQNPEATEWLLRALRGLQGPAPIRDAVEELKVNLVLFMAVPDGRLRALMRPRNSQATAAAAVAVPAPARPAPINLPCPICQGAMVVRRNRTNGQEFYGCSGYPNCRGTRNIAGVASRGYQPGATQPATAPKPNTTPTGDDQSRYIQID